MFSFVCAQELQNNQEESVAQKNLATLKRIAGTSVDNTSLKFSADPKLARIQKRSKTVHKLVTEHWQKIEDGSLIPWSTLRAKWPDYERQLKQLRLDRDAIIASDPADGKEATREASKMLIRALQPLGPFLQPADYRPRVEKLTADQAAELTRLEQLDFEPSIDESNENILTSLNSKDSYTLIDFSAPIDIQGPPNTSIYITANGGGHFENELDITEIKTNENGLASTSWVSRGNSVGQSIIRISSPQCINTITLNIEVVGLKLIPLPELKIVKQ